MKAAILLCILPLAFSAKITPSKPLYNKDFYLTKGVVGTERQSNQFVDCWEYFSQQGASYRITDYISQLPSSWDNRLSSCCFNGIWIFYQDRDYNKYNQNVSHYLIGASYTLMQ